LQLQSGQSDGIFAAIWQADRDVWGQFPGRDPDHQQAVDRNYRLWQVDYPIITRIDSPLQWNGQQFSGLQSGLSAPLGYIASQRLQALGVHAKVNQNAEKALQLVALGRLDGYVIERQIGNTLIRKLRAAVRPEDAAYTIAESRRVSAVVTPVCPRTPAAGSALLAGIARPMHTPGGRSQPALPARQRLSPDQT
jgi:hypothetical protein